jgi:hypothetical protein
LSQQLKDTVETVEIAVLAFLFMPSSVVLPVNATALQSASPYLSAAPNLFDGNMTTLTTATMATITNTFDYSWFSFDFGTPVCVSSGQGMSKSDVRRKINSSLA